MSEPTATLLPEIRVLGPVTVVAGGVVDPTHRHRLAEIGAYLALTPGDHDAASVDAAIWPDSPPAVSTRHAALSRLRRWWGQDEAGKPYVDRHSYRVRAWTDWGQVCQLTGYAGGIVDLTGTFTADLTAALQLVRGRPFGSAQWRYAWAERLRIDIEYLFDRITLELLDREGPCNYTGRLSLAVRSLAVPWASLG